MDCTSPSLVIRQTAGQFDADITVENLTCGENTVNAKSIISVLTLGVLQNHEIRFEADRTCADEAIAALRALVEGNFDED